MSYLVVTRLEITMTTQGHAEKKLFQNQDWTTRTQFDDTEGGFCFAQCVFKEILFLGLTHSKHIGSSINI